VSRAERLLKLVDVLRRYRRPVSGIVLAEETGVSIRTLYRDIASLQAQGAPIEGERGLGYVLKPGFMLPPLMFLEDELEALMLGSEWVASRAETNLGEAARRALGKIASVLPPDLNSFLQSCTLVPGPSVHVSADTIDLAEIRKTIRAERKVVVHYRDAKERETKRTIWPFALGYLDGARIIIGWCELRQGIRHFRADRISLISPTNIRYPRRRASLMKDWRVLEGLPAEK